jgi:hypothetical protein
MTSEHKNESKTSKTLRYSYTVFQNLATAAWECRIAPGFKPDEVIIRAVNYYAAAGANNWMIWSDMVVGDGLLCSFQKPSSSTPGSHFRLKSDLESNVQFAVRRIIAGPPPSLSLPTVALSGNFSMTLEFVKY